jgi:hypothetical protein
LIRTNPGQRRGRAAVVLPARPHANANLKALVVIRRILGSVYSLLLLFLKFAVAADGVSPSAFSSLFRSFFPSFFRLVGHDEERLFFGNSKQESSMFSAVAVNPQAMLSIVGLRRRDPGIWLSLRGRKAMRSRYRQKMGTSTVFE